MHWFVRTVLLQGQLTLFENSGITGRIELLLQRGRQCETNSNETAMPFLDRSLKPKWAAALAHHCPTVSPQLFEDTCHNVPACRFWGDETQPHISSLREGLSPLHLHPPGSSSSFKPHPGRYLLDVHVALGAPSPVLPLHPALASPRALV